MGLSTTERIQQASTTVYDALYTILDQHGYTDGDTLTDIDAPWPEWVTDQVWTATRFKLAKSTRKRDVARWLNDPDQFSPYVDEVALTRAMAYDWPVIDALTLVERAEFYQRLSLMDDPTEAVSLVPNGRGEFVGERTARRVAWEAGTDEQRARVMGGTATRRDRVSRCVRLGRVKVGA